MLIDAAQVATAQRHAVAVEKLQNLDRDLAAVVDAVTELRGGKLTTLRMGTKIDDDFYHFRNGRTHEEVIVRHFVRFTHPPEQLEQAADVGFAHRQNSGDVAHTWRTEAFGATNQRRDTSPGFFVFRRQPHFVAGKAYPGAVQADVFPAYQLLQCREKCQRWQFRAQLQPQ